MSKALYSKLAILNIRKNGRIYIPYIISSAITIAMFYIMCSITFNKDAIGKLEGADSLQSIMGFGTIIIALFSFIFLFYTNSFLMKRRKNEIGLFNILGMEKRHISRILFWEVTFTSLISLIFGIGFGILFDKLITLALFKILKCTITFGFGVRPIALTTTILGFILIFFLNLFYDIAKVRLSNPIELLHGSNVGEKEPKTKWILAILGLICLTIGYTIAIYVKSPLDALMWFFVAVVLVIIGTYFLFISGSIALLKLLRKNKKYYYNPKHFTSVSGMLYRMKQNAVGLANICILSTMVLVMLSTTVCLYVGVDDALMKRYPMDASITIYSDSQNAYLIDDVAEMVQKKAVDEGRKITNAKKTKDFSVTAGYVDGKFSTKVNTSISSSNIYIFCFKSESEYKNHSGKELNLKDNEAATYTSTSGKRESESLGDFTFNDVDYKVVYNPETFEETSMYSGYTTVINYVVVSDKAFKEIYDSVNVIALNDPKNAMDNSIQLMTSEYSYDIDGTDEEVIAFNNEAYGEAKKIANNANEDATVAYSHETRASEKDSFYSLYGSFLFLGIYLGTMFLMITALIMYYKQISEGFEDKHRFEIMQKVGMSKSEIKKSIHSQVITVFFMPLAVAVIHIAFAFKMITRLLVVFNLTNVTLFLICTIATAVVFAVIYAIVYIMTARAYYKIVE